MSRESPIVIKSAPPPPTPVCDHVHVYVYLFILLLLVYNNYVVKVQWTVELLAHVHVHTCMHVHVMIHVIAGVQYNIPIIYLLALSLLLVYNYMYVMKVQWTAVSLAHVHVHTIAGVQYNIPITIWLRPNHPYICPMVYVTPTRDMGIQQSQFVDNSGMVYLPYLNEWKVVSQPVLCSSIFRTELQPGHSSCSNVSMC